MLNQIEGANKPSYGTRHITTTAQIARVPESCSAAARESSCRDWRQTHSTTAQTENHRNQMSNKTARSFNQQHNINDNDSQLWQKNSNTTTASNIPRYTKKTQTAESHTTRSCCSDCCCCCLHKSCSLGCRHRICCDTRLDSTALQNLPTLQQHERARELHTRIQHTRNEAHQLPQSGSYGKTRETKQHNEHNTNVHKTYRRCRDCQQPRSNLADSRLAAHRTSAHVETNGL